MKELRIEALVDRLNEVQDFVQEGMDQLGLTAKACMQVSIAVEELFVNIASYAYTPNQGEAVIRYDLVETDGAPAILVELRDQGKPFDPWAKKDADVTLSAEEREIGGLGIYMVKKSMDRIGYEYRDGWNVTTILKKV